MAVDFWWWLIAAVLLIGAEALLPGIALLWLGVAAAAVGIVAFLLPGLGLGWQAMIFAVLAVASVIVGLKAFPTRGRGGREDHPDLNDRRRQLIGRRAVLTAPIVAGRGKAQFGDTFWSVTGPDLPAGSAVEVTGVEEDRLVVAAVDAGG